MVNDGNDRQSRLWVAWLYVALLMPVAALNYYDRQMLAAMKVSVMNSIPDIATEANWGYMLAQFKWVYAILSPIGGFLADRFSRRKVICGSLFVWSAVTWATGNVTTYSELLWARSLMGISEAFYIPAALALISDYHQGRTRSRAVAFHQMAIYLGVIGGGFSGYIADAPSLGWRSAFWICGIVGMIYALPLLVLLRDAPPSATEIGMAVNKPTFFGSAADLLRNPSFLLLVAYFTLPALAGWVVRDWMPVILKERYQIVQGLAGVSATLYLQVAAIFGAILGGWWSDRWMRSNNRGRIYVSAIGMSFIIPSIFGVGNAATLGIAVAFLILFGLGWGIFDCNNMPILCQIAPASQRATGYGLMNMVSISFGGLADWGFGVLRDASVPLNVIFGTFAAIAVLSVIIVLMIRPRPELIQEM